METSTVSITFNGKIDNDNEKWIQWYKDAKMLIELMGYIPTHVGIGGVAFKSGKVLSISKSEKKILKSLENGDEVYYISLFSLPKDYKSASFDYDVLVARDEGYVTLIANKGAFDYMQENELISKLRGYISASGGEIYEMDRDEVPLLYAAKDNPPNMYKSLKVLKTIN